MEAESGISLEVVAPSAKGQLTRIGASNAPRNPHISSATRAGKRWPLASLPYRQGADPWASAKDRKILDQETPITGRREQRQWWSAGASDRRARSAKSKSANKRRSGNGRHERSRYRRGRRTAGTGEGTSQLARALVASAPRRSPRRQRRRFLSAASANGDPLMADDHPRCSTASRRSRRVSSTSSPRVSTSVGREGKMRDRVSMTGVIAANGRRPLDSVNSLDHRSGATDVRGLARHQGGRRGRSCRRKVELEIEGKQVQGEFFAHRLDRESNGRSAQRVRERSDARGARSRHRRQARRAGERAGRGGHLEGPHRLRERDGVEPDRTRCATSPT